MYYLRHIMERTEIVEIMMTILHMCMYAVWTGEVVYATGCHCLQTQTCLSELLMSVCLQYLQWIQSAQVLSDCFLYFVCLCLFFVLGHLHAALQLAASSYCNVERSLWKLGFQQQIVVSKWLELFQLKQLCVILSRCTGGFREDTETPFILIYFMHLGQLSDIKKAMCKCNQEAFKMNFQPPSSQMLRRCKCICLSKTYT